MAAWVDVSDDTYWANAYFNWGNFIVPNEFLSPPCNWDGTKWPWSNAGTYQKVYFKWIYDESVVVTGIRLTIDVTTGDMDLGVFAGDGFYEYPTDGFSAISSGVGYTLTSPGNIIGFYLDKRYTLGGITKIELFMEPLAPPVLNPFWTNYVGQDETCP